MSRGVLERRLVYLIDEAAHPRAGGQHEQSVREENEVALI